MKMFGVLLAVLLVLVAPVSRGAVGKASYMPDKTVEEAVVATDTTNGIQSRAG